MFRIASQINPAHTLVFLQYLFQYQSPIYVLGSHAISPLHVQRIKFCISTSSSKSCCTFCLILHILFVLIISGEEYKLQSFFLCNFSILYLKRFPTHITRKYLQSVLTFLLGIQKKFYIHKTYSYVRFNILIFRFLMRDG
jgi:hypothetical protein